MTGLHYLVVPDDPDRPMEIDHPADCPQHGKLASVRDRLDGSYLCVFEEMQWTRGLETFFRRSDEDVPLFTQAPEIVQAGRHPIEFWASEEHPREAPTEHDWGLRLCGDREGAA